MASSVQVSGMARREFLASIGGVLLAFRVSFPASGQQRDKIPIVGFVGAGAGVLLAMLASAIFAQNLIGISSSFDWTTIIVLVLAGMAIAIGASSLTALPASSEKPMSVLRYE